MKKTSLSISYFPTDLCNYHCDYCYRNEYKSDIYTPTKHEIDKMFDHLQNYDIESFRILGGEPTLYSNIDHLITSSISQSNIHEVKLISNGSNNDKLLHLYELSSQRLKIGISIHPKYFDFNTKTILSNINTIKNIRYRIVLDIRYKKEIEEILHFFKKIQYNDYDYIELIIDNKIDNEYSNIEFCKEMYKLGYNKTLNINPFLHKRCYNNIIKIEPKGNITYDSCHKNTNNGLSIYKIKYNHRYDFIKCTNSNPSCLYNCEHNYHE